MPCGGTRDRRCPPDGYGLAKTAKSGDVEGARQLLRDLDAGPLRRGMKVSALSPTLGSATPASALPALTRATDDKEIWPQAVTVLHTPYDAIRGSVRFNVLLTRVGLGEYTSALTR